MANADIEKYRFDKIGLFFGIKPKLIIVLQEHSGTYLDFNYFFHELHCKSFCHFNFFDA